MVEPVLIFAYGNLSRGDDALGPLLLDHLNNNIKLDKVELLNDFQLQVEHALDLENRELVLFVDAAVNNQHAFQFQQLQPSQDKSYTTHAMSPSAVMQVYQQIKNSPPPPCFLLSIQGSSFELGEELSDKARQNLKLACLFAETILQQSTLAFWQQHLPATPVNS